jgi:hypothetical protein
MEAADTTAWNSLRPKCLFLNQRTVLSMADVYHSVKQPNEAEKKLLGLIRERIRWEVRDVLNLRTIDRANEWIWFYHCEERELRLEDLAKASNRNFRSDILLISDAVSAKPSGGYYIEAPKYSVPRESFTENYEKVIEVLTLERDTAMNTISELKKQIAELKGGRGERC